MSSVFWAVAMVAVLRPDDTISNYYDAKSALGDRDGLYSYDGIMRASKKATDVNDPVAAARLAELAETARHTPDGYWRSPERLRLDSAIFNLKQDAAMIFVPILISFTIGAALLWAIRGFSSETKRK